MLVKIQTGDIQGVDAYAVDVEVDATKGGMPGYNLVGLPSASVVEGKVRVRAALVNAGYRLDARRVTVNLAPAEIRKDTAAFDLPIALGVLGAYELLDARTLEGILAVGELALDGSLRRINGVLPIAVLAQKLGARALIVPAECAAEARLVSKVPSWPVRSLNDAVALLRGDAACPPALPAMVTKRPAPMVDLADVSGQALPRRALEIAAAGGHNLLMVGPPGSGKSMLARRLPTILPPMTFEEQLETTKIYSVAGLLNGMALIEERPFRAPHHTVSPVGLVGGGPMLRPGEVSLSHNGVLFLDELLEFQRGSLEALRQPLEDGYITVTRARGTIVFPAALQLVAAMNPCPCGHRGDNRRTCTCSDAAVNRYWSRLSGPLLDRIDLVVHVPTLTLREMTQGEPEEPSERVGARVIEARERQLQRLGARVRCNARTTAGQIRKDLALADGTRHLLEKAVERLGLSARAIGRILKVARTIADLEGADDLGTNQVAEALGYRQISGPPG